MFFPTVTQVTMDQKRHKKRYAVIGEHTPFFNPVNKNDKRLGIA